MIGLPSSPSASIDLEMLQHLPSKIEFNQGKEEIKQSEQLRLSVGYNLAAALLELQGIHSRATRLATSIILLGTLFRSLRKDE